MSEDSTPLSNDYRALLEELKARVRSAQVRAAVSVNSEMVMLYWQIGTRLLTAERERGWGAKVVDKLAADLRNGLPAIPN